MDKFFLELRALKDKVGSPGKRPYTRDELEDLSDCVDERVLRIRRAGDDGDHRLCLLPPRSDPL